MTDIFLEYLLKKKSSAKDVLLKTVIIILAVILMIFVFNALLLIPMLRSLSLLGAVAVVYSAFVLLRNFDVEYEYIFTNGELDIDVIKGRKIRKRLVSISCRNIVLMASFDDNAYNLEFENQSITKTFDAVYDASKGGVYGIIFSDTGERRLIKFQPSENLIDAIKKYNPRCVFKA